MGSNTSKGKAEKGSKFWMQMVVNDNRLKTRLDQKIGYDLEWLSPLKVENYAEYELRQQTICEKLQLANQNKKPNFDFWPNRQPQWDGIAMNKDHTILYIVEAKAHPSELRSKLAARSKKSKRIITSSMNNAFQHYSSTGQFEKWVEKYYQLGNRMTFLYAMNHLAQITGFTVKLILLNFVKDTTYKPTTEETWRNHYKKVFCEMFGTTKPSKDLLLIYFPVS